MYIEGVSSQVRNFLFSLGFGFLVGIFYDVFRILRLVVSSGKTAVFIGDLLYVLLSAAATFLFLLTVNDGQVRGYILAGELIGFLVWYISFGAFAVRVTGKIVGVLKKAFRGIFRIILYPFYKLYAVLRRFLAKISEKGQKKAKKIANKSKFHLKMKHALLYNHCIKANCRNKEGKEYEKKEKR